MEKTHTLSSPTFDEILKRLDDIVIDLILPDAASRTCWRNMRSKVSPIQRRSFDQMIILRSSRHRMCNTIPGRSVGSASLRATTPTRSRGCHSSSMNSLLRENAPSSSWVISFPSYPTRKTHWLIQFLIGNTARDITRSQSAQETIVVLENFGRFCLLFGPFSSSILFNVRSPSALPSSQ